MFTGIIEDLGEIKGIKRKGGAVEITIGSSLAKELGIDDSISINGVCLTVVQKKGDTFMVQAVEETLRKTAIGDVTESDFVNLERALPLNARIDGHFIQGHVDATGIVKKIEKEETNLLFTIQYPEEYKDMIVGRGSISVDGISLTVAREQSHEFTVAIIPYTIEHTNLKNKKAGDKVNLEFDIIGKYVQRFLQNRKKS